jgi:hypothetical protein
MATKASLSGIQQETWEAARYLRGQGDGVYHRIPCRGRWLSSCAGQRGCWWRNYLRQAVENGGCVRRKQLGSCCVIPVSLTSRRRMRDGAAPATCWASARDAVVTSPKGEKALPRRTATSATR